MRERERRDYARWIDENLDYGSLYFFPTLWAVNVQWHEKPERRVDSYAVPKGRWKRFKMGWGHLQVQ